MGESFQDYSSIQDFKPTGDLLFQYKNRLKSVFYDLICYMIKILMSFRKRFSIQYTLYNIYQGRFIITIINDRNKYYIIHANSIILMI